MSQNKNIEIEVHLPTFIWTSLICTLMTGAVFVSWSMANPNNNNNQAADIIRAELKRIGCVPSKPVHVTLQATKEGGILFNTSCQMHVPGNKSPWPKQSIRKSARKPIRKSARKPIRKPAKARKRRK